MHLVRWLYFCHSQENYSMKNLLKFILKIQIKHAKFAQSIHGFTLIELLVGLIIAVLAIAPLLGFTLNMLDTDRREQAKATSEQEIQTALDFIERDLQQAIYIYDANGINAIRSQLPDPTATDRVPVLVFWKREFVNKAIPITTTGRDDTFVYSLVAYYLIKDPTPGSTWSPAARIARWQIKDGVVDTSGGGVTCTGYTARYISSDKCPDPGFALFNLDTTGSLRDKMNNWRRNPSVNFTNTPIVLVDFIDQTTTGAPAATCPPNSTSPPITWSRVTPDSFNTLETGRMTSFYACVDTANTAVQVFLRGNALARLQKDNLNYRDQSKTYFPTASIRVQGRGFLFTE